MARWIYNAPPSDAHRSEQDTAAHFQSLPDDGFLVRWGYYYLDHAGVAREGDFLIQGPNGHLLVLEAKAGRLDMNPATGFWSTADGTNPLVQLDTQWAAVRDLLTVHGQKIQVPPPFIDRALALPDVEIAPEQTTYHGIPRGLIFAANDLRQFARRWEERVGKRHRHCRLEEARQLFGEVYGASVPSGATSHTLDFGDQLIERHTQGRFEILDALEENSQLVFSGGPGTGKTWFAIEQARRWSREGRSVLLLCYNLELEAFLKRACRKIARTEVLSYQSLAAKLLGGPLQTVGRNREELSAYYDHELPMELLGVTAQPGFKPLYDALIVDEAQDHNTSFAPQLCDPAGTLGWWSIYFRLLREGQAAPVAIFHDGAQRLSLRAGSFEVAALRNALFQPVSAKLTRPLRYTRQLRAFFGSLVCEHTSELLRDMARSHPGLPEGPEPEVCEACDSAAERAACVAIIKGWIERGLAQPHEIAVLYPSSRRVPAWLGSGRIDGLEFDLEPLCGAPTGRIRAISIQRSKGLERRGVVLVGVGHWSDVSRDGYDARTFVLGATRAQSLLGIVHAAARDGGATS